MPKKRTSAAEKLVILRTLMVESKCVWNLKELERAGTKKGIVTQAIKDVLQSLCDDNLVDSDKIGSGAFFWTFPSKARLKAENKLKDLEGEQARLGEEQQRLNDELADLTTSRSAPDRSGKLELHAKLCAELKELENQEKIFEENSPAKVAKNEEDILKIKAGVNRWTDNIWCAQSFLKKKFTIQGKEFWKLLEGINDEMDSV